MAFASTMQKLYVWKNGKISLNAGEYGPEKTLHLDTCQEEVQVRDTTANLLKM